MEHWAESQEPSVIIINWPLSSFVTLGKAQKLSVFFIYCCLTNYLKLSGFKQQTCIIPQFLQVRDLGMTKLVLHRDSHEVKNKRQLELQSSEGSIGTKGSASELIHKAAGRRLCFFTMWASPQICSWYGSWLSPGWESNWTGVAIFFIA